MTKFTIHSDVPLPRPRSKWGDVPWRELNIGQSISVDETDSEQIRRGMNAMHSAMVRDKKKGSKMEFKVLQTDDGFGIWRTR